MTETQLLQSRRVGKTLSNKTLGKQHESLGGRQSTCQGERGKCQTLVEGPSGLWANDSDKQEPRRILFCGGGSGGMMQVSRMVVTMTLKAAVSTGGQFGGTSEGVKSSKQSSAVAWTQTKLLASDVTSGELVLFLI